MPCRAATPSPRHAAAGFQMPPLAAAYAPATPMFSLAAPPPLCPPPSSTPLATPPSSLFIFDILYFRDSWPNSFSSFFDASDSLAFFFFRRLADMPPLSRFSSLRLSAAASAFTPPLSPRYRLRAILHFHRLLSRQYFRHFRRRRFSLKAIYARMRFH